MLKIDPASWTDFMAGSIEFVGVEWEGLFMTHNDDSYTNHARWILEKRWDADSELMRIASAILGFTGVEIGILGAMNPNLESENIEITKLFSRGLIFVTVAQILLAVLLILKWNSQI